MWAVEVGHGGRGNYLLHPVLLHFRLDRCAGAEGHRVMFDVFNDLFLPEEEEVNMLASLSNR